MNIKNKIKKDLSLILIMGIIYLTIEVTFRALMSKSLSLKGWTSLWMIPVGGLSCYIIGILNEKCLFRKQCKMPMKIQGIIGSLVISFLELSTGYLFNIKLGYKLWNYYDMPLNICGQVSLLFSIIWVLMVPLGSWTDDVLRYYLFGEIRPSGLLKYYKKLFSFKWE